MLGDGRPFAVQLNNARELPDKSNLVELEEAINGGNSDNRDIRVLSLAQVSSRDVLCLNVGQEGEIRPSPHHLTNSPALNSALPAHREA